MGRWLTARKLGAGMGLWGVLTFVAAWTDGRAKKDDGFPDYGHVEYVRPRPPADQQVKEPPPGSINLQVGGKKNVGIGLSLDQIPTPLFQPDRRTDDAEPPLYGFFEEPQVAGSSASATVATSTAPAKQAPHP